MHPARPFLFLLLSLPAIAGTPGKVDSSRYEDLWKASPFTNPKIENSKPPVADPFEGYSLLGVSNIGDDRFRVTLVEKASPDTRIQVDSGSANPKGFRIVQVNPKDGQPLATTVVMAAGSRTGTVKFDEKFLAPAKVQPDAPKETTPGTRPPRVRAIQPPTKTLPAAGNTRGRSGH